MFSSSSRQNQTVGGEKNLVVCQLSVCYIPGLYSDTLCYKIEKRDLFILLHLV